MENPCIWGDINEVDKMDGVVAVSSLMQVCSLAVILGPALLFKKQIAELAKFSVIYICCVGCIPS